MSKKTLVGASAVAGAVANGSVRCNSGCLDDRCLGQGKVLTVYPSPVRTTAPQVPAPPAPAPRPLITRAMPGSWLQDGTCATMELPGNRMGSLEPLDRDIPA